MAIHKNYSFVTYLMKEKYKFLMKYNETEVTSLWK